MALNLIFLVIMNSEENEHKLDFFKILNKSKAIKKSNILHPCKKSVVSEIPGLFYVENFVTNKEAFDLINEINKKPWNLSLKRRTQHYGYSYDYKSSHLNFSTITEPIPDFVKFLLPRLNEQDSLKDYSPDQLIINEYVPGQGISAHIDRTTDFEDKICSLSLGSDAIMEFQKDGVKKEVLLKENSLVILTKDSRYLWTHCIPGRKSDKINGVTKQRRTRISLTFRKKKENKK